MKRQHLLDLEGGYGLAASPDDVLDAIEEVEVAIGVDSSNVAGVKPAVAHRLDGGLRVAPVVLEHPVWLERASDDTAWNARGQLTVVGVEDANVVHRMDPSGRSRGGGSAE